MSKKTAVLLAVFSFLPALFFPAFCEEMVITTYYPSPYGSYNELTSTGNTYLATAAAGKVGVGTAAPGVYKLYVNGSLAVNSNTADKTGAVTWGVLSDARLKEAVGDFGYGLDKIMELKPVRYRYKQNNIAGADPSKEHIGFIAQEVASVLPEAVRENSEGYLVIDSDPILWTMLNAIKELKIKNQALEERVSALESKVFVPQSE
ncbi:MAG: tail fiber domain-containing protein [Candidatus Omnitrophica bacterium]|nr:tail fiber domain-containing protein [Candidatus Omnitrophota bacterium]MDD5552982.1 tail fiber domain-containing protein [Candidatus Omnitrophota bacterium]